MGGTSYTVLKGRELSGRGYVQGKSLQLLTRLSDYTVWQRFRSHIQSAFSAVWDMIFPTRQCVTVVNSRRGARREIASGNGDVYLHTRTSDGVRRNGPTRIDLSPISTPKRSIELCRRRTQQRLDGDHGKMRVWPVYLHCYTVLAVCPSVCLPHSVPSLF